MMGGVGWGKGVCTCKGRFGSLIALSVIWELSMLVYRHFADTFSNLPVSAEVENDILAFKIRYRL
jgi:hypothetical protein